MPRRRFRLVRGERAEPVDPLLPVTIERLEALQAEIVRAVEAGREELSLLVYLLDNALVEARDQLGCGGR